MKADDMLKKSICVECGQPQISLLACRDIALKCEMSFRDVEIFALKNSVCPARYVRNIGTIGIKGQILLLLGRVAVVGCGGLGGWIAEMLARIGVGEIVLVDGDTFCESNLNRQLFCTENNLGMSKAHVAALRISDVNSAVSAYPVCRYADRTNGNEIFSGCLAVIDGVDNNKSRNEIFSVCKELNIPFVHGAVGGLFGQFGVFRSTDMSFWSDTENTGAENDMGTPTFLPPFIAALQVCETVKILTKVDLSLQETLIWLDLRGYDMQKIKLKQGA